MVNRTNRRKLNFKSSSGITEKVQNVPGIVYELPQTTFANESVYPQNWCYENNLPSGVHNATNCKDKNTPLFISFPHFYGADPFYINQMDPRSGLNPTKEKHGSKMIIEQVKQFIILKSGSLYSANINKHSRTCALRAQSSRHPSGRF